MPAGNFANPFDEILAAVDDDVVTAVGTRQFGLLVAAHRADHGRAQMPRPLAGDQSDSAGGGVQQDGIARLHPVGAPQQVLSGHALQHHGGGGALVDGVGQRHHPVGGDQSDFGVSADRRTGVGHPVAGLEFGHALADRFHPPRAFHAQRPGQRRQRIQAGTVIDIDVVEPDGGMAHPELAGAGIADLDFFPAQDFGTTVLMNADRSRHGFLLRRIYGIFQV